MGNMHMRPDSFKLWLQNLPSIWVGNLGSNSFDYVQLFSVIVILVKFGTYMHIWLYTLKDFIHIKQNPHI